MDGEGVNEAFGVVVCDIVVEVVGDSVVSWAIVVTGAGRLVLGEGLNGAFGVVVVLDGLGVV